MCDAIADLYAEARHECSKPAPHWSVLGVLMAPIPQMTHFLGDLPLRLAFILAVLSQTILLEASQSVEDIAPSAYGSDVGSSGCTMGLGRKDLAPVFISCR